LGDHASVWMGAVIRGDVHSIRIGAYSNIQDNCVVHVFKEKHPTVVADHVTVGHSVTLHGCRVDSHCLIGMGATILNDAHVGERSIVAAGTLVPEGMEIPPGSLVMGLPAKVRRPLTDEEREHRYVREELLRVQGELSRRVEAVLSQRKIQAVKGTRDILPDAISAWHRIEAAARELFP